MQFSILFQSTLQRIFMYFIQFFPSKIFPSQPQQKKSPSNIFGVGLFACLLWRQSLSLLSMLASNPWAPEVFSTSLVVRTTALLPSCLAVGEHGQEHRMGQPPYQKSDWIVFAQYNQNTFFGPCTCSREELWGVAWAPCPFPDL